MAKTVVSDIIVPSVFETYALERTAVLSRFVQAGIVQRLPELDALASGGGRTVDMPFWQDLSATRQILSDGADLTVNKITVSKDIARIHNDAQVWGANDLVGLLAGEDPVAAIGELVGSYWARIDQSLVVSSLKGIFGTSGALTSTNKLAIGAEATGSVTSATQLNGTTFVDATVKLGDRGDSLTAIAMHSATEAALRKLDLIATIPASNGVGMISMFQGRRVVVDDTLPTRAGTTSGTVYTSYLFGAGVFGHGAASLNEPLRTGNGTKAVEFARVPLASDDQLINRRRFILHPRGVKFNSTTVAGDSPTNAELETVANWTRVYEAKNCRIVAIDHNN